MRRFVGAFCFHKFDSLQLKVQHGRQCQLSLRAPLQSVFCTYASVYLCPLFWVLLACCLNAERVLGIDVYIGMPAFCHQ